MWPIQHHMLYCMVTFWHMAYLQLCWSFCADYLAACKPGLKNYDSIFKSFVIELLWAQKKKNHRFHPITISSPDRP